MLRIKINILPSGLITLLAKLASALILHVIRSEMSQRPSSRSIKKKMILRLIPNPH
jgi:hypothetical protein